MPKQMLRYDPYEEERRKEEEAIKGRCSVVYLVKHTPWAQSSVLFEQRSPGSYTYHILQRQGNEIILNEDVDLDDARSMIYEYKNMGFFIDFDGKLSEWKTSRAKASSGL